MIIDADYYNNPDNEGHIFFSFINLSPFPIMVKKGNVLGQGVIKPFLIVENEKIFGNIRSGGFGSSMR